MSYLDALQATLAAENAAVYLYAYLGAQTSTSEQPALADQLLAAFETHQTRRDDLTGRLTDAGATPTPAAPAYDLPDLDGSPSAVRAAAATIETRCQQTYLALVASSPSPDRRTAVEQLVDAAVRAVGFGADPTTFPGR